jgi:hypothetical protein
MPQCEVVSQKATESLNKNPASQQFNDETNIKNPTTNIKNKRCCHYQ